MSDKCQQIPDKAASLTDEEWLHVLERDKRRCWRWEKCENAPCSTHLDKDHRQPQSLFGDDSFANLRLACEDWNRRNGIYSDRKDVADEYWTAQNWWDGSFTPGKLRNIQFQAGYDAVLSDPHFVPLNHRNELLRTVTLLPGFTGIGKTILMQSVLFAFNKVTGVGHPRHKHVILFEPHRTLRDLVADEWRDDAFNIGMVQSHPLVHVRESWADLAKGPMGADVVVCCPQTLWEVERANGQIRSSEEVRRVLAQYDTLIFDECDSANERIRRICEIGSHAVKYWMTASPPIGDQKFMDSCVLINNEAIADYKRALDLDQCVKLLADNITPAAMYGGAEFLDGGVRVDDNNAILGREHTAFLAAIKSAVVSADNLEREMKRAAPEDYYSPHIIVRLEKIDEIKALARDLPPELDRMRSAGLIHGEGWNVSAVYQGHRGESLSDKDARGEHTHPFMLAKGQRGRATKKSARILLMAEIGTRGINNWPILYVVDLTVGSSAAELIQFNFGRPSRLPPHLAAWVKDESKSAFVRTVVTSLRDLLVADGEDSLKAKSFKEVSNFVNNQVDVMAAAGFLTWEDLASGKTNASVDINFATTGVPFSASDKLGILVGIGRELEHGPVDDKAIERVVDTLLPPASGRRKEKAFEYGRNVATNNNFRKNELPLNEPVDPSAARVVTRLKPQEIYDKSDLLRFVQSDESYAEHRSRYVQAIETGDFIATDAVSRALRTLQANLYREAPTVLELNKGVLRPLAYELMDRLKRYGEMPADNRYQQDVFRSVNGFTKTFFGVENAQDNGPLDVNAYHTAILGKYKETILKGALARLVKGGFCPNLSRLMDAP